MSERDIFVFGGIACTSIGAGLYSVAAGLIVFGVALVALGLAGAVLRRRR